MITSPSIRSNSIEKTGLALIYELLGQNDPAVDTLSDSQIASLEEWADDSRHGEFVRELLSVAAEQRAVADSEADAVLAAAERAEATRREAAAQTAAPVTPKQRSLQTAAQAKPVHLSVTVPCTVTKIVVDNRTSFEFIVGRGISASEDAVAVVVIALPPMLLADVLADVANGRSNVIFPQRELARMFNQAVARRDGN